MTGSASSSPDAAGARLVPAGRVARGAVRLPPSKSAAQRYLALALLARRPAVLHRLGSGEDVDAFLGALAAAGFAVERRGDTTRLVPGSPPAGEAAIDCGAGGTMLRFLAAVLTAVPGRYRLDGVPRLRERPLGPLLDALRRLGGEVRCLGREGHAPLAVTGGTLAGGATRLDAGSSSQFLSALLLAALGARRPVEVEVTALASAPYVDLTLDAIRRTGGEVERRVEGGRVVYRVAPRRPTVPELAVEGDDSAAAYPAAAAALTGGEARLLGLRRDSLQGDRRFLDLLAAMGASVIWDDAAEDGAGEPALVVRGGELRAVDADLGDMPDQVPTLAALAPFAAGTTTIRGVPHLRFKESDRLAAMARELGRLGAPVEERADGLVVPGVWATAPPPSLPVTVASHGDHRIAMALALVGLRRPGVSVGAPGVVAKSYPGFWEDLERLVAAREDDAR